jgi:hypothetical protein
VVLTVTSDLRMIQPEIEFKPNTHCVLQQTQGHPGSFKFTAMLKSHEPDPSRTMRGSH